LNIFKTHISGFDELFDGGMPVSTFLVIGPPGSGSEMFVREISYRIASKFNVSYVSFNSSIKGVQKNMTKFDTSKLEKENKLKIISNENFDSIIDTVNSEVKKKRSLVIDSLSDLIFEGKQKTAKDLLKLITEKSEDKNPNFVLLTEGMQTNEIEIALQHYAEGVIHFTTLWDQGSITRFITIRKIRGGMKRERTIPYSITENGVKIETSLRIS
jgi:KaiC/GvpD/RAD55 family RecA-like ATPase